jgi:glycerol-3-phosphate dehydrogenase
MPTAVDVLIVGAGVTGCSIAASLSRDELRVVVVERRHDIVDETSKSNTGVMDCGWECEPGTLESDLIRRSSPQWEEIAERLDVPWDRCGGISLARTDAEAAQVDEVVSRAHANGVASVRKLVGNAAVREVAPFIGDGILAAAEVPDEGIIDSIRLTLGYAELAARNGVQFRMNAPVVSAETRNRRIRLVHTPSETFAPRLVVNAAGLGADTVSRLLGGEDFRIWPRRGEYLLVDREFGRSINKIVTQLPNSHTRGVMVVPTTHGSLLLGPTAEDEEDKSDRSTHRDVLRRVLEECATLVPSVVDAPVIKTFAGLRPASEVNYRVGLSEGVDNLIQACGIRSTGVSASPAMGEHVRELIREAGVSGSPARGALDRIPHRLRLSEVADPSEMAANPLGCTVVCACEKVTALEIHDALTAPIPARSVAGVAKRTRATWGRCQGSACLSGVTFLTSLHLDGEAWELPMSEPGATLGVGRTGHA